MAAYKIGAEGGIANSQHQLGYMHYNGEGVDGGRPDHKQALVWYEKAAAQDDRQSLVNAGQMFFAGLSLPPSWRRAREYWQRAIDLGSEEAKELMQSVNRNIQEVTRSHAGGRRPLASSRPPSLHPARPSTPPSWTSGSRSSTRAATT